MKEKYRFGFQAWGLILFLVIMLPNFVWFFVPVPNDVLRQPSVTPGVDAIASVFQIIMVAILCAVVNINAAPMYFSKSIIISISFCVLYYLGWILYYMGIADSIVMLCLTVPPCLAFLCFAIDRKNIIALLPIAGFTVCHAIYAISNFVV